MSRRSLSVRPTDPEEAYADDFAMNLLMPEDAVRAVINSRGDWITVVSFFGVPQEIAVRRLKELGLWDWKPRWWQR